MKRDSTSFLVKWLDSTARKPLVIRGARQVGKTWLIRDFAKGQNRKLIEINFEKQPSLESLFTTNDPKEIIANIAAWSGEQIQPTKNIIFLDEIQAAPHLLAKLRWFAEDMAELPVVAAGSLLDFALSDHEFSMPVGRISYMYLEPLSFEEFLDATGQKNLRNYLEAYTWLIKIPTVIHTQLMTALKEYLVVGGMPAAVSQWKNNRNPEAVNQVHLDLLATYRDDFAKYSGRLSIDRLESIMTSVPRQLGQKFVYKHANTDSSTPPLKQALDLLSKARICHKIMFTSANGLPLGAEVNEKFFKVIMLDCGLCSASLGLPLHQLKSISEITVINSGGMAEQLVGQLLRTIAQPYVPPAGYYWRRDKKGAEAEVDYIIAYENQVIPVEVKAGKSGSLKSLHRFMYEKKKSLAIRVNSDMPIKEVVGINNSTENPRYDLLSVPFYLLGQINRLITIA